jgi:hypothetical protein
MESKDGLTGTAGARYPWAKRGIQTAPPHRFYAPSKIEGRISSSSISVRGDGEGGNHAVFDPYVKVLFTTFALSSPITYIFAKISTRIEVIAQADIYEEQAML